jgi:hypothetical protein
MWQCVKTFGVSRGIKISDVKSQMTVFKTQMTNFLRDLRLICHIPRLKSQISRGDLRLICHIPRLKWPFFGRDLTAICIDSEVQMMWFFCLKCLVRDWFKWHFWNVIWDSNAAFEVQMTLFKMAFETQIHHLRLRWHFWECCLRLKLSIWGQMTFLKMSFETQIQTPSHPPSSLGVDMND